MSKFLLNLLVQISNVCQKPKFQIKFERILFLELWPSSGFWPSGDHLPSSPTGPLSPSPLGPSLPAGPTCPAPPLTAARALPSFLLPQDEADRALSLACATPHRPPPPSTSEMARALTPHHFPSPADPLPKWLIMELHYATAYPSMDDRLCSSPQRYKRCSSTLPPSHCPGVLPLSFPPLLSSTAVTAVAEPDTAVEQP
jgi:hypothetical protein